MAQQVGAGPAAIGHLDQQATLQTFAQARDALDPAQWTTDASANLALIAAPALDALRAAGVPVPQTVPAVKTQGMGGLFYPSSWTIRGSATLYGKPQGEVTAAWMRARAVALYHEARHAEQYFMAAKLLTRAQGPLTGPDLGFQALVLERTWELARTAAQQAPVDDGARPTIRGWIADALRVDEVVRARNEAREALIAHGDTVRQDLHETPIVFADEPECDQHQEILIERIKQAGLLLDLYAHAFDAYLRLAPERDAYAVAARVGGVTPNARTVATRVYLQRVLPAIQNLTDAVRSRTDACLGPPPLEHDPELDPPEDP